MQGRPKKRRDLFAAREDRIFNVVNGILLAVILVIILYPLLYILSASFSDPYAIMDGEVVLWPVRPTLRMYARVFQDENILIGYRNTIMYTVAGTVLNVLLTITMAYALSRKDFKGRKVITIFITLTIFFDGGMIPRYLVVRNLGLINTFGAMILPKALVVLYIIVTRTFLQTSIPDSLQESAIIDGASNLQVLVRIILPLAKPVVAVITLFYGVMHWNQYFEALLYLTDSSRFPLQLILRDILIEQEMQDVIGISLSLEEKLVGEGVKYAVIIVASVPVLIIYPFIQRYFVKGVMLGALKG